MKIRNKDIKKVISIIMIIISLILIISSISLMFLGKKKDKEISILSTEEKTEDDNHIVDENNEEENTYLVENEKDKEEVKEKNNENEEDVSFDATKIFPVNIISDEEKAKAKVENNSLSDFDITFLKFENGNRNVIYSPLSIKYLLSILKDSTNSNSYEEIKNLIKNYESNRYKNSPNFMLSNAIFVKDVFKDKIKSNYINNIKEKYDAELIYDSFNNTDNINNWIKNKTLNNIDKLRNEIGSDTLIYLVNALAIDMDWDVDFFGKTDDGREYTRSIEYDNQFFRWTVQPVEFDFKDNKKIAVLNATASFNNYDSIKAHGGEEKFKKELTEFFTNCYDKAYERFKDEFDYPKISSVVDETYENIAKNYGRVDKSTEFSLYVDDDVKVFAKDLKNYGETTLQYVAFMPKIKDLNSFIKDISAIKLQEYINNLKTLDRNNFKDGVIVEIDAMMPKFKYSYETNIVDSLKELGVKEIFDESKANLSMITDEKLYVNDIQHKSSIDFNEYGIKVTATAGLGYGGNTHGACYYEEKPPIETIDLKFDKPFLYIIRDKNSGEVLFVGSVYNPLLWSEHEKMERK